MKTPIKHLFAALAAYFCAPMFAFAQAPMPTISTAAAPAGSNDARSAASGNSAAGNEAGVTNNNNFNLFENKTSQVFADKFFDVNQDSINPETGTMTWKGKTFDIGNLRVVRARFERYLTQDYSKQNIDDYQAIFKEVISSLSVVNDDVDEEKIRYCWSRLFDAAQYEIDGDMSLVVANNVYASWRMRQEYGTFSQSEKDKRREFDEKKWQALEQSKIMEYDARQASSASLSRTKMGTKTAPVGASELANRVEEKASSLAELASVTAMKELTGAQAVLRYQSQVVAFLMGRKFQHAQVACVFYRYIYRGTAQEVKVGDKELKQLFPVSGFVPTNDALESLSLEAQRDIKEGMDAVNMLYDTDQKYSALERLMETFALGEYDYNVRAFPYQKKVDLLKIYKNLATLKNLADNKDWGGIEDVLNNIKPIAKDFPYQEVLSKVKTAQRASDMRVLAARQAAALGNLPMVEKNLMQAAEFWPLNPGIEQLNKELVGLTSGSLKYTQKFDELYERGNYRDIMEDSSKYALAFMQDKARADKLKKVVENLSRVDMLIAQSDEFATQKNYYAAWEMLENAKNIEHSDPLLSRAIAALAPQVADYVKILSRAKESEKNGDYAVALNYYLAAQEISPTSQVCRLGVEECVKNYRP